MINKKDPVSVVCFGDSLTWGFNPADKTRYGHDVRWTRRLQSGLGDSFYVTEAGLNGRTTVFEDPVMGDRNGLAHLAVVRRMHMPIDILVIMLGTNDLKARFGLTADTIANCMARVLRFASQDTEDVEGRAPEILLMSPPPLGDMEKCTFLGQFNEQSHRESFRLKETYKALAQEFGIAFFDTGTVISASDVDAVHFDAEPQAGLATAVAAEIRKIAAGLGQ